MRVGWPSETHSDTPAQINKRTRSELGVRKLTGDHSRTGAVMSIRCQNASFVKCVTEMGRKSE